MPAPLELLLGHTTALELMLYMPGPGAEIVLIVISFHLLLEAEAAPLCS